MKTLPFELERFNGDLLVGGWEGKNLISFKVDYASTFGMHFFTEDGGKTANGRLTPE